MLDAMAYASGMSRSGLAAFVMQQMLPVVEPVTRVIAEARTAPAEALRQLSTHAELVAQRAESLVQEIRREAARTPPSSNTGG